MSRTSVGAVVNASGLLNELANTPMSGLLAAQILRLLRWSKSVVAPYLKNREALAIEHGEKQENGQYKIAEEHREAYSAAMNALTSAEVAVPAAILLEVPLLRDVQLTVKVLETLEPFLATY